MQKSLVFKEKFKHIHHPGQTKYSMSVGIGCLSHLFAGSVPGEGLRGESKNYLFIFFIFIFAVSPQMRCKMQRGLARLSVDHRSWAWPCRGQGRRRLAVGNLGGGGGGTRDTFSGRDKDKRDRQGERGPKSCW